ncbi:arginine:ornithine antiporter (APA family) [Nonomuraea fuscirosea]|uniref:Arginine:ornithine antiporter (APA family) n=1 Tax=Nonomuraea fuscirosea TaxID=1291556 RepID=A0A2T0LU95_9ACTN|nr:basic amino acid/polyamine antiporter [Nonomuraea fuscirosea]PRX47413.1 arginine:ornithine antiporter (APA family) [Nonomuraea fuscirosea]
MDETVTRTETTRGVSLPVLTAMVVGSMVGAGVFSLPRNFAQATGVLGAVVAWVIAGVGMLMLAFVFQTLAVRKPDLNAGVYAYAKEGFGQYPGFFSAFGYWASACVGNVTYWVLIKSTIGLVVPVFGEGATIVAVVVSTAGVWAFHFMILRGVREAARINQIVTVAKLLPILLFVVIVAVALRADVFGANLLGDPGSSAGSLFGQVRATMLVTVFVFLGVEGASVYSRYARERADVGRATVLGFLAVLALFASVSILSYGVLPKGEMSGLRQPSMGGVLESVVGAWGAGLIGVGLIVSVLGAYLAWTLMAAEVLFVAAKDADMPAFLARENQRSTPVAALVMTSALITAVLFITLFSDDAFTFTLELTSALSLIPYLLAAGYALRLALSGETYDRTPAGRGKDLTIAALATFYTAFLIVAAGLKFLLLSCIVYAPGTILFVLTRRERGLRPFSRAELVLFIIVTAGAVLGVTALITGRITI